MEICGKDVQLGDYVVAMYTSGKKFGGGTIRGVVTKLWETPLQVQLNDAWCFHDNDFIVELRRPTSRAVDEGESAPLQAESTLEDNPIEGADTIPPLRN